MSVPAGSNDRTDMFPVLPSTPEMVAKYCQHKWSVIQRSNWPIIQLWGKGQLLWSFKVVLHTVITEILLQLNFLTTVERFKHKVQPSVLYIAWLPKRLMHSDDVDLFILALISAFGIVLSKKAIYPLHSNFLFSFVHELLLVFHKYIVNLFPFVPFRYILCFQHYFLQWRLRSLEARRGMLLKEATAIPRCNKYMIRATFASWCILQWDHLGREECSSSYRFKIKAAAVVLLTVCPIL